MLSEHLHAKIARQMIIADPRAAQRRVLFGPVAQRACGPVRARKPRKAPRARRPDQSGPVEAIVTGGGPCFSGSIRGRRLPALKDASSRSAG